MNLEDLIMWYLDHVNTNGVYDDIEGVAFINVDNDEVEFTTLYEHTQYNEQLTVSNTLMILTYVNAKHPVE